MGTRSISPNQELHSRKSPYLSTGDNQLNLAVVGAHQSSKLLTDTLQDAKSVVLGQGREEVLHDVVLPWATSNSLQFLDDLGFIGRREGWRSEDNGQFNISLEHLCQSCEGFGGLFQAGCLGRCGILDSSENKKGRKR